MLACDPLEPVGLHLGPTMGELFCLTDDGDTWRRLPAQFPRITLVKVWAR